MDLDYSKAISERALEWMSRKSIPATADNYAVWFHFVIGVPKELHERINELVVGETDFDKVLNDELYRYLSDLRRTPSFESLVSDQMGRLLEGADRLLASAIDDSRFQIEVLNCVAEAVHSKNDFAQAVSILIAELAKASQRTSTLQERLSKTSAEIQELKASLAEAELRSKTDALTGLANRHLMEDFLRTAVNTVRGVQPMSAFLIDIDHFKSFNDKHGHLVGDQILRFVASVLKSCMRDTDLALRYGGDELAAILPGTDLASAVAVAERVCSRISEASITKRTTGEKLQRITVSIGAAQLAQDADGESLIESCDRALYRAKRTGRNQVACDAARPGPAP